MSQLKYFDELTSQWVPAIIGAQGPQGPQGPVGPKGDKGVGGFEFSTSRVGLNQYTVGEIVFYVGSYYICIANNDAITPTSQGAIGVYWNPYSFSSGILPLQILQATVNTNTEQVLDSLPINSFAGIEYIITVIQGLKVRTSTVIMHTNGVQVDGVEYGVLETGGSISGISISTNSDSNSAFLNIIISDANSAPATVKMARTLN